MVYADPESARSINRLRVLNQVHQRSPVSRAEIARETGLTKVTVSAIVVDLIQEGVLLELGKQTGTPGRNATTLGINSQSGFIMIFDVGLWKTRYGVINLSGEIVFREAVLTPSDHSLETFLDSLTNYVEDIRRNVAPGMPFLGASFALSGLVDSQNGTVRYSPNWNWENIDMRNILSRKLGLPVALDNNVRTMLLGEKWFGDTITGKTVFYINWAHGIGSALMVEDRILPVDSEFGHLQVSDTGRCSCGKTGCVELQASGRTLREAGNSLLHTRGLTVEELLEKSGEVKDMAQLFQNASVCIGRGASAVANIISPDLILLGGGLSLQTGRNLQILMDEFGHQTMRLIREKTRIKTSSLGDWAGFWGAAALGLDSFLYQRSFLTDLQAASVAGPGPEKGQAQQNITFL